MSTANNLMCSEWLAFALSAANVAGQTVMSHYSALDKDSYVRKDDGSPLTAADVESHDIICQSLSKTNLPIISEEGLNRDALYDRYWLVDPLDGTKDFLAKNDEFCVNIALIESERPVLGVIYAPALGELFYGGVSIGAWHNKAGVTEELHPSVLNENLKMAVSRFHNSEASVKFGAENRVKDLYPIGASLKFGRLAQGQVDVYPRFVGTSEWDVAAGQAILESCGGGVIDLNTKQPLLYGKAQRRNSAFIAFRPPYSLRSFNLN